MMIFANHLWAKMRGRSTALSKICKTKVYRIFGIALTFTSVSVAWVLFRAADLGTAGRLLHAMFFWRVRKQHHRPLKQHRRDISTLFSERLIPLNPV